MYHQTAVFGPGGGVYIDTYLESIDRSNAASAALKAGRVDEAIALHKQALELKLLVNPESSPVTGVTFNGLGEALLRAGRLEEADESFSKALAIREEHGPDADIASTRDNMGELREAQGRFAEAREVRLRGAAKKMIMCGNYDCPTNKTCGLDQLSACGACQSVFYCSKSCQKMDWTKRHKPLCQARGAAAQASTQAGAQSSAQAGAQASS
ncbi:hypothetical protein F4781DRAFT_134500 [Annulohypoxylon bovei var. microspora]|nr:hypothetical protein F4781DRAFT_134500 [Annulohypoxylon bovei var. microspora]